MSEWRAAEFICFIYVTILGFKDDFWQRCYSLFTDILAMK